MRKIILYLFILVIFGCKEGKRTNTTQDEGLTNSNKTKLELVLQVIVPKDDVFEVYYHEPEEKTFTSKNYVFKEIKGGSEIQEVSFTIPDNIYPERLRIDLGKNIDQGEMIFKSARFIFGEKEYVFSEEEIKNQFKPSKFMLFDPKTRKIKTQRINNKYDPYFYTMKVNGIVDYLMED